MNKSALSHAVIRTGIHLIALILISQFCFVGLALARNCTTAEKSAADAQLWLNKRDKKASLALHMLWGVLEPSTERILIHRDYVIGYSDSLLVPLWTAHRLEGQGLGKASRVNCFRPAPRIPAPAASLPSDYNEPIFDQGHMTPNGDMSKGTQPVLNSFILSNMTPQHCQFNRGVWQILETLTGLPVKLRIASDKWVVDVRPESGDDPLKIDVGQIRKVVAISGELEEDD